MAYWAGQWPPATVVAYVGEEIVLVVGLTSLSYSYCMPCARIYEAQSQAGTAVGNLEVRACACPSGTQPATDKLTALVGKDMAQGVVLVRAGR